MKFSRGVGEEGVCQTVRDGEIIAYFKKQKIWRGGRVVSEIPSVVGVWIFSGTTHFSFVPQKQKCFYFYTDIRVHTVFILH